jgi:hypothetical protein
VATFPPLRRWASQFPSEVFNVANTLPPRRLVPGHHQHVPARLDVGDSKTVVVDPDAAYFGAPLATNSLVVPA